MISIENTTTQLDDLLDKMAEAIQLDDSRYDRMKKSYESVKSWIENDEAFFRPYSIDVYPQGSVRILTTVKPIVNDEFDLDIVIHLKNTTPHTPQKIYTELKRCLEAYAKKHGLKIESKNRCIRLVYAGDFHIDILPAVQENAIDHNRIKVPDRKLGDWVSSNPRGYSDWFIGKANLVKESLLEKSFKAEKLPIDGFKYKKPLQRAVQLIKRYRDMYFQNNDTFKTSSIILTTIAGEFYSGEESIFDTIDKIITTIRTKVSQPIGRLKVLNPVNPDEDFTDSWDKSPEYYEAFKQFSKHLYNEWQKLKARNGVPEEGIIMKGLFGDDILQKAQSMQTEKLESFRKKNMLGIDRKTGVISTSAFETTKVKPNTFFGK